ncbi:MAG: riboflavin synthase [Bacteroidia bacterium]|nr:riboflavin synthase [Bacteroidia bacterium]NNF31460.1 riboflavin synthase [Flavobacteriaceae bacterium]MBT8275535.1 riboflavin synthase [Bacteroidia bacterium]NNJ82065.1 riboflavin synthase [Flavobacteriaceae bacterium]NNK54039.1 riboflavin synthase [Flavobacteriaceae bacterium]
MFTGIIESLGTVSEMIKEGDNVHLIINSSLCSELSVDQSVSHDGICLTVVDVMPDNYKVTAIKETMDKTNLGELQPGSLINLERAMKLGARLDGHIVQGHVDETGICTKVEEANGSWYYTFTYNTSNDNITIEKGSITVNGVSLTVVNSKLNEFSVAIIPYTYENTNFKQIRAGDTVNLEFDVIGKYVKRLMNAF